MSSLQNAPFRPRHDAKQSLLDPALDGKHLAVIVRSSLKQLPIPAEGLAQLVDRLGAVRIEETEESKELVVVPPVPALRPAREERVRGSG
jgi:hypothetical protein